MDAEAETCVDVEWTLDDGRIGARLPALLQSAPKTGPQCAPARAGRRRHGAHRLGRSTGFCVDPIEEAAQSLSAWLGSAVVWNGGLQSRVLVLQNWDISKLSGAPKRACGAEKLARAERLSCASVATRTTSVIFLEYAPTLLRLSCARRRAHRRHRPASFARSPQASFAGMDAANVDLKASQSASTPSVGGLA